MQSQNTQPYSPRCEVIKDIRMHCSHIFAGGHRCASPALRSEALCYHHQPSRINLPTRNALRDAHRRARRTFPLLRPTNQHEALQALMVVVHALAADTIAPRRAAQLIAALQHMNGDFSRNLNWDGLSPSLPPPNQLT